MKTYANPFRTRTSEHLANQGIDRYLRTFGVDALDLLPDELWDRLLVLSSAPGAGKTSLLRVVSAESIYVATHRKGAYEELVDRLRAIGALDDGGQPLFVGFRVPLSRDFAGIVDLEPDEPTATRMFLRLLDARIMSSFCAATRVLLADRMKSEISIAFRTADVDAARRVGGSELVQVASWASTAEAEILDRLDSVLPLRDGLEGHGALYSLRALSGATVLVDGVETALRPLLLLDDGQDLHPMQRTLLLDALHDRELRLSRWYTERYSAMEPEELMGDGEPDRNRSRVRLESEALHMGSSVKRGSRTRRFDKLLADIADRRASRPLTEYDDEDMTFTELLDADDGASLGERASKAAATIRGRLLVAHHGSKYAEWFRMADELEPLDSARRWRELEILVARDVDRPDLTLFELELGETERKERSSSSIREAADLWLRREFSLPFYWGSERIAKLAAENIEQYLNISADLFDEMLAGITLRRGAVVSRLRQDGAVSAASQAFWTDIPQRRAGGRQIQQLLRRIAALCRTETYRPKAPYAPGVTGTAMSMRDRARLLDENVRNKLPGAQELYGALHGAIGHNLLHVRLDHQVKNQSWMVLYLNRLTCARYGLPLGYGGFREKSLEQMCEWMLVEAQDEVEPPIQERLDLA